MGVHSACVCVCMCAHRGGVALSLRKECNSTPAAAPIECCLEEERRPTLLLGRDGTMLQNIRPAVPAACCVENSGVSCALFEVPPSHRVAAVLSSHVFTYSFII